MHKGEKTVENKNEKKDEIVNNENTTTEKKKILKREKKESFIFLHLNIGHILYVLCQS